MYKYIKGFNVRIDFIIYKYGFDAAVEYKDILRNIKCCRSRLAVAVCSSAVWT